MSDNRFSRHGSIADRMDDDDIYRGSPSTPATATTHQQPGDRARIPSSIDPHHNRYNNGQSSSPRDESDWNPMVVLNTAPSVSALGNRVKHPTKATNVPKRYRRVLGLDRLSIRFQEVLIMEDLLSVLMGEEGIYIKFSESFDPGLEYDRLAGPDYRIAKGIDPYLKDFTISIIKTASYYISVDAFIEVQSKEGYGQVNQALCAGLRTVLKHYLTLVTHLEEQLYDPSTNFTLHNFHLQLSDTSRLIWHAYELAKVILLENKQRSENFVQNTGSDDGIDMAPGAFDDNDQFFEDLDTGIGITNSRSMVCKGGSILKILAERKNRLSGDPIALKLYNPLLEQASAPYLQKLSVWIHKGVVVDPADEFMVQHNKSISLEGLEMDYMDEYWEGRYTIRTKELPLLLLSSDVYEKILLAGKYLNVIRECGGVDVSREGLLQDNFKSIEDNAIIPSVNNAFSHANKALLELLINTHDLRLRLRSLKQYFFLDKSDFFINFLDIAETELKKPVKRASAKRLQYLLDMALRQPGSISSSDPFNEDVTVDFAPSSVIDYLLEIAHVTGINPDEGHAGEANGNQNKETEVNSNITSNVTDMTDIDASVFYNEGHSTNPAILANTPKNDSATATSTPTSKHLTALSALQLDFKISFPLSLVISRKTIVRYQLIFRHLVSLKHIERLLSKAWVEQAKSKSWQFESMNQSPRIRIWKRKTIDLRLKMIIFIQHIQYYCTVVIIEPNWQKLQENLDKADLKTVDAMMKDHLYFLDTSLRECMLTNVRLLMILNKLFLACRMFAEFLIQQTKSLEFVNPELAAKLTETSIRRNGQKMTPEELLDWMEKKYTQYEVNFNHHLNVLIESLNYYAATETSPLFSLCAMLKDFL